MKTLLALTVLLFISTLAKAEPVQFMLQDSLEPGRSLTVYIVGDREQQTKATDALYAALDHGKRAWNSFNIGNPESELSKINAKGKGVYTISADLSKAITEAVTVAKWSEGRFEPVFSADSNFFVKKDFRKIALDPDTNQLTIKSDNLTIDLHTMVQGLVVDIIADDLNFHHWPNSYISLNSTYLARGHDANGPWKISVEDQSAGDAKRMIYFKATDLASATFTGLGTQNKSDLKAVTIFTQSAAQAAAFSGVIYSMGLKEGSAFLKSLPYLTSILVDAQGQFHKIPDK